MIAGRLSGHGVPADGFMLRLLIVYLAAVNILAFALFAADKRRAVRKKRRISEACLLGVSFAGGAAGGLISMYLFRHKTKHCRFTLGLPLMLILHAALLIYIIAAG